MKALEELQKAISEFETNKQSADWHLGKIMVIAEALITELKRASLGEVELIVQSKEPRTMKFTLYDLDDMRVDLLNKKFDMILLEKETARE